MILRWALELEKKAVDGGRHCLQGRMDHKIHSHSQGTRPFSHYPLAQRCPYDVGQEASETGWGEVPGTAVPMPLEGIGSFPPGPRCVVVAAGRLDTALVQDCHLWKDLPD